jgi:ABC-type multidrug transport system fused ATPase/permease subunit
VECSLVKRLKSRCVDSTRLSYISLIVIIKELFEFRRAKSVTILLSFEHAVDSLIIPVVHYSQAELLEQEAPHEIPDMKPPPEWPAHGAIEFRNVSMRYRPGLPTVLHGISMSIKGGEKIGIVGRTGAGKSSITLALLRIVEYLGEISIDGYVTLLHFAVLAVGVS